MFHQFSQTLKIKRAKLIPFGGDHQRIGAVGARISAIAVGHVLQNGLGLVHAGGIEGADPCAHVLERRNQRHRGSFAHVIGVGLEGQAEHRDGLAAQAIGEHRRTLRAMARFLVSLTEATASRMRKGTS